MEATEQRARKIRDRIRGNFDRGAGAYQAFEEGSRFFRTLLEGLLALGPGVRGRRVLDVGCGTGASLALLRERVAPGGAAVGLDLSLPMLREARRGLGEAVPLVGADACRFGSTFRCRFDAVVYNAVVFMLPDARGSLASAGQVLESGGRIYLSSLDGVWVDGEPVPDALARMGVAAGNHAVSPWPAVEGALQEIFEAPSLRRWSVQLSPDRFEAFYGLEPMSAGLMPGLPYGARRQVVEEAARQWRAEGRSLEQVWVLACAAKP